MPIQCRMTQKLTPVTALLLTIPPLLWAGNAVVGRLVSYLVPPITLNFLRWALALPVSLASMSAGLSAPPGSWAPHSPASPAS